MEIFDKAMMHAGTISSVVQNDFYNGTEDENTICLIKAISSLLNAAAPYAMYKEDVQDAKDIIDRIIDSLNEDILHAKRANGYAAKCTMALASLIDTRATYDRTEKAYKPECMPTRPVEDCKIQYV